MLCKAFVKHGSAPVTSLGVYFSLAARRSFPRRTAPISDYIIMAGLESNLNTKVLYVPAGYLIVEKALVSHNVAYRVASNVVDYNTYHCLDFMKQFFPWSLGAFKPSTIFEWLVSFSLSSSPFSQSAGLTWKYSIVR